MKHKTAELTGALLDAAVAKAEGMPYTVVPEKVWGGLGITFISSGPACSVGLDYFEPSTNWAKGGPIIERERIQLESYKDSDAPASERRYFWVAVIYSPFWEPVRKDAHGGGETPLIAAMRAYVASKLGDEVDL